jgi:hypothetical protein
MEEEMRQRQEGAKFIHEVGRKLRLYVCGRHVVVVGNCLPLGPPS